MIIWVNGTFGAGKTTTAEQLLKLADRLRTFDPEWVGYMVRANLTDHQHTDFQDLPPWRALVPVVADELARFTGQDLVAVQTVLDEGYWQELYDGLVRRGHEVKHVLLDVEQHTLHARIDADPDGAEIRPWRHDHVEPYLKARPWLTSVADLVVDTTRIDAATAATQIRDRLGL